MNRDVAFVLSQYNFSFDHTNAFGKIHNYEVNVFQDVASSEILLAISTFLPEIDKTLVISRINELGYKNVVPQSFEFGLVISVKSLDVDLIESVLGILKDIQAPNSDYCPLSGKELNIYNYKTIFYPLYGFKIKINLDSATDAEAILSKRKEEIIKMPNHFFLGFLGILIGGVAAVALSALFFFGNYVPMISGFSALLGLFLYRLFKGKLCKATIVISSIVSIVFVFGSIIGFNIFMCGQSAINAGKDYGAFEAFAIMLSNPNEARNHFIYTLVINFVEIAISEFIFGLVIYRRNKSVKT